MSPYLRHEIDATGYRLTDAVSATPRLATVGAANPAAQVLVELLTPGTRVTLQTLADGLVERFGIEADRARQDVAAFVDQAQRVGAISFHSSAGATAQVMLRPAWHFLREPFDATFWRWGRRRRFRSPRPSTIVGLAARSQALLGVLLGLPLTLLILPVLLGIAPWSDAGSDRRIIVGFGAAFVLGFVALGVIHELTHYLAARVTSTPVHQVYAEGLRVGLQYSAADPLRTAAVTLAGPLVAVATGVATMWWLAAGDGPTGPGWPVRPMLAALALVCTYHLACLVPPAADGQALLASIRRGRAVPGERHTDRGRTA